MPSVHRQSQCHAHARSTPPTQALGPRCSIPRPPSSMRAHALRAPQSNLLSQVACLSTCRLDARSASNRGLASRWLPSQAPVHQSHTVCRSLPEGGMQEEGPLDGAMPAVSRWWETLTLQQKIYTVAVVLSLVVLLPKLFILFVVGLHDMFVGSLLAVEEAVRQLISSTTALGLTEGLALLACAGIYVFLSPQKQQ